MKYVCSRVVLFATDYETMTSGWQRASYFRRHDRELISKPAIPFKKSWGGYLNPFTTGNPFLGTKLLGFSIGRGLGALKGLNDTTRDYFAKNMYAPL